MDIAEFNQIPEGEIFRIFTTRHHTIERVDGEWPELTFVCKKGHGYNDWTIYCHFSDRSADWIAEHGNKVMTERNIRSIFPCSDEVYALYRF